MRRVRAPIDFRRGASSRLTTDAGTFRTIRLLGFVPAGGPFRLRADDFVIRVPTIVPALGFASFRVVGRRPVFLRRNSSTADSFGRSFRLCVIATTGSTPLAASSASGPRISRRPIRSWALRRPSQSSDRVRRRVCPPPATRSLFLPGPLSVPAKSPALQRVVGLMPGRSDEPRDPPDRLPV